MGLRGIRVQITYIYINDLFCSHLHTCTAEHVIHQLAGGRAGVERVTVIDTSQDVIERIRAREKV